MSFKFLSLLAVSVFLASVQSVASANPIPLEHFFGNDSIRQMVLSPDGNKIAMLAPNNGRYSIALLDTTTGKASVVVHFKDEDIQEIFWKGNDRILFFSEVDGHEVPLLASTDLQGKSVKRILRPKVRKDSFSIFWGTLVDDFPASDHHILIVGFTNESDPKRMLPGAPVNPDPAIYRVNVKTADRTSVLTLDGSTSYGLFDGKAQQRLAELYTGNKIDVGIRANNSRAWRRIRSYSVTAAEWDFRKLLADGRTAVLFDYNESDRGELRTLDVETGALGPVLFSPEGGEVTRVIYAPRRQRVLGVEYEDTRKRNHWLDEKWAQIAGVIERSFPDHVVSITSISDDEKRFLFTVESDRDPGRYFLADLRSGSMQAQLINAVRPAIKPDLMSPMVPISFTARDGLTLHGYLTKPGGRADASTPLLVLPHGGPFGIRDSWEFNPEVQFLANRGYAVLQVNYRGSGGYGWQFQRAGYQEWGGKMQDDLTDAVEWVVGQGWADGSRVGIIGASYGGYAALIGAAMTPERYKVAINYVGVTDLRLITRWDLDGGIAGDTLLELRIGRDPAFLASRSPVNFVSNIRVPTLHAYGANDPRVEITHWQALEAALKKHGKVYESLIEQREGHGFHKAETSLKFYLAVESFLARHLPAGGRVSTGEVTAAR